MTKLTFYRGLQTIGGTFAAVETDEAICLFDFGFTVSNRADSSIHLRERHVPQDYVRLGMLPDYDGIYEPSAAKDLRLRAYDREGKEGKTVFFIISHMHIDHMGGLDMLDPEIPVYMSEDSLLLYRRLAAQKEWTFREHTNCIGIPYGKSFEVKDIRIQVLPIDHDCCGAAGFLIHTKDKTICYTGDYRFHGWHPELTQNFADQCRGADVLITEGTTLSFQDVDMIHLEEEENGIRTEAMLLSETEEICKNAHDLVVINPYNRNVERIHRVQEMLSKTGRTLVLDAAQGDYLATIYPDDPVFIYAETACGRTYPHGAALVSREELLDQPGKYVLQLDYHDFYELFDLSPRVSAYLHMDGAPLGSYEASYEKMTLLLKAMDIPYHYMSLGGHAYPWYIRKMIDTIEPDILIPLHSEHPERVSSRKIGCRILPKAGVPIEL